MGRGGVGKDLWVVIREVGAQAQRLVTLPSTLLVPLKCYNKMLFILKVIFATRYDTSSLCVFTYVSCSLCINSVGCIDLSQRSVSALGLI